MGQIELVAEKIIGTSNFSLFEQFWGTLSWLLFQIVVISALD